ncbi:ribonuclease HIII [Candidatus Aminicenantes bacterium AC-335-K20]|jgi:ribonuclease HIII|nr:ribonuclease HIII [SCandidatus Aminicenantes bacterium Aminicenantia_JdfR_composite]MCP2605494.1 ribonuclease HIII [Candidatus Aminicenantes bacterium AC-335-O07]MCP2619171.1 ribonuclease HIII [Candidatus Aminicenantes bacterium AC-335-K20]MCP2620648.1 ribonuclease HIII [Candidatus Aminicenantes bacterium AC-334-E05]
MSEEKLFKSRIGTDESGKGDYFGPLVVAGVYVKSENDEKNLKNIGVRDCKRISDRRIIEIAEIIKKNFIYSIVLIGPEKYNELYKKMRNLNRILAWAHSRVIENILNKVDCNYVITDQFADEKYILNTLMEKGKKVFIEQQPKAEEDIAVASASVLARAEFLVKLDSLSKEIDVQLLKGSSSGVKKLAKEILLTKGEKVLNKIAKLHFRITQEIKK